MRVALPEVKDQELEAIAVPQRAVRRIVRRDMVVRIAGDAAGARVVRYRELRRRGVEVELYPAGWCMDGHSDGKMQLQTNRDHSPISCPELGQLDHDHVQPQLNMGNKVNVFQMRLRNQLVASTENESRV